MRLVAIVAVVALSGLAVCASSARAQTDPRCAVPRALASAGQTDEAIKEYVALLKTQPSLPCAVEGLQSIARASKAQKDASSEAAAKAKCDAADELADADERAEAKKLYLEALKAGNPCGRAGLDVLDETRSWTERWKDRLGDWTDLLGVLVTPLLVALLLGALVWIALTYVGPFRRHWRHVKVLGHPLQPSIKVGTFEDASSSNHIGSSVGGVLSSALSELGRDQKRNRDDYRLDNATGAEGIESAVTALGDLSPHFKVVAGILTFVRQLARSARYELRGIVQAQRDTHCGLTVSLDRVRGGSSTSTLWDAEPATDPTSRMYYLAAVAAGWADFRLRQREQLERPEGFKSAESYGHFRAAVEAQKKEDLDAAISSYREALLVERRNVPALLNLARLEGRRHHYAHARTLLDYAIAILDRELADA